MYVHTQQYIFQLSILIAAVVLSVPQCQPSLLVRAWDQHRYNFCCSCARV